MRRLIAAATASVWLAGAAAADPLEGLWRTAPDDEGRVGLVAVAPCGAALCGTIVRAFDAAGAEIASPEMGRLVLWDTVPEGGGAYRGRVYAPDRDQEYASRLRLSGDTLAVSGCVLGLCREGGTWTRE